ncbi:PAS domain-containing protein [Sphingomonas sp. ID1715]|nr:PAS domain-containing protein [Sphingomonas sp. ID1715]
MAQRPYRRVLTEGVTVEDEVVYRSPTRRAAYFSYLWGPARGADGSVDLVVGVSRDTSEHHDGGGAEDHRSPTACRNRAGRCRRLFVGSVERRAQMGRSPAVHVGSPTRRRGHQRGVRGRHPPRAARQASDRRLRRSGRKRALQHRISGDRAH